jgi:predicted negative regulator of RcsB-dependent stress response
VTIHRDDLESKLREIETVVADTQEEARGVSKWVIAGAVVLVVGYVAYRMWRRSQRVQVIVVPPQR